MPKTIKPDLVRNSILWTLVQYQKLSIDEKAERRIRGWRLKDEAIIAECITAVRIEYRHRKDEWKHHDRHGGEVMVEKPDFQVIKDTYLAERAKMEFWDPPTKNLYSSVVSTYIDFDRDKNGMTPETADTLQGLSRTFHMFIFPEAVIF